MGSIVAYINDYNLYTECRHGFRKDRSCATQLLHAVEDLSDMSDNCDLCDIYLDLKKPFIKSLIYDWLFY